MYKWTRRDVLRTSLAAPAVVAAADTLLVEQAPAQTGASSAGAPSPAVGFGGGRERLLLDFGWTFHLGHASDATQDFDFWDRFQKTGTFPAVGNALFNDSDWRSVNLPHDWGVELPFQADPTLTSKGFHPVGRAYPATSVGWYRRIFELPTSDAGKRITLEFDGVHCEAMVILNGFHLGTHIGGYDPFSFDVTDFASPGARNTLVVRVDAAQNSSSDSEYEGAGIYRHVWLVKTNPVHVKKWGTFARTEVRPGEATVRIRTEVENHGKGAQSARVTSTILDRAGKAVGKAATQAASIVEGGEHTYEQQVVVKSPALWSLKERNLYTLVTEVEAGGAITDRYETRFGIRTCAFDAEKGFFLNGESVKLKGVCHLKDHAGVGAALPDAVQYYRVRTLQEMGCNAMRTTHHPPTPELLNAADELGMMVLDETRRMSSNPEGLSLFENLVRRDRNRPCVFIWSMGNEEPVANTDRGALILTSMKAVAARHDGSRPVTTAPIGGSSMGEFGFAVCDVQGNNYAERDAEAFHKANPKVPVMGTENVAGMGTRGIYVTDPQRGYVWSYDPPYRTGTGSCEGWWSFCNSRPWMAGGFIWSGFDYRGETTPYGWPNVSSQYGIIDLCGFPKDNFYYLQSWWTQQPVLHVFPHWNWPGMEGREIVVRVYSNLERVELFLNGQSLGAQDMKKDGHLDWVVKYAPGVIEARGFKGGQQVLTARRETTGPAAKLAIAADRKEISADGEDVAVFAVAVQDAQGRVVPAADNGVTFRISGQGRLIGVGNGDPTSHESDKDNSRKAFSGLCMAIVQSSKTAGNITVEASSPGLTPASVAVVAKSVTLRPQVAVWEREVPAGPGITGLWRPASLAAAGAGGGGRETGTGQVFTLRQNGTALTGTVEGAAGARGGAPSGLRGETPAAIEDGKVDGANVTFTIATVTYTGTWKGDRIELQRSGVAGGGGRGGRGAPAAPVVPRPAIGPAPDGSGPPSGASGGGGRGAPTLAPLVLVRAKR